MSLAYLQQGNVKKSPKLMKIVNTDEENLHIFRTPSGILMKFSGNICLMITLKVEEKNKGFTPSLRNTVLEKLQG